VEDLPEYLEAGPVESGVVPGETLQLVVEPTGLRHFLAGQPLHPGAEVELLVKAGGWVRGSYHWSFDEADAPTLTIDEPWGPHRTRLEPDARLRWPA
jgi:hypothetical protein